MGSGLSVLTRQMAPIPENVYDEIGLITSFFTMDVFVTVMSAFNESVTRD